MEAVTYRPIGVVHSPFTQLEEMPIQPGGQSAAPGTVEVFPEFEEGLADLEGFSHVFLLVHLHLVTVTQLTVTPFLDDETHGVFATRAPVRPNPIGLSVVELTRREGATLYIANLDMLDGTPVLDIKPYLTEFDAPQDVRRGWLESAHERMREKRADGRFARSHQRDS